MIVLDNNERVDKVRKITNTSNDNELASVLETSQPQISRWRNAGFHVSTAKLIDYLLNVIIEQREKIRELDL